MKTNMFFSSAIKTHFQKKGFAPSLFFKVRVLETRNGLHVFEGSLHLTPLSHYNLLDTGLT